MAHTYAALPEQAQEDALHAARLLQVEERPFQRVTRNLLGKDSPLKWTPPQQLPSPPPDGEEDGKAAPNEDNDTAARRQKFRADILLDFAALESSILRIQLIHASNQRERERYATEKAKILATAQAVKDNTVELRAQLAEAQHVLELRKGYDAMAAKLIDPKKLKPRAETREDIGRLEKEIEDLEAEGADFEGTWATRREAFERVVAEGEAMMRVVKGIKDEPEPEAEGEKDEHMMEEAEAEGDVGKGEISRIHSPTPREGRTPMPEAMGIPAELEGGITPRPDNKFLDIEDAGMRSASQMASPALQPQEDVEMVVEEEEEERVRLEPQPKTTAGMEVSAEQVATPAEGMEGTEDQVATPGGVDEESVDEREGGQELMDES